MIPISASASLQHFRCPRCGGAFEARGEEGRCQSCRSLYPIIGGIPDLRLSGAAWVDFESDRSAARALLDSGVELTAEQLIRHVFNSRPGWDEQRSGLRARQVMESPERLRPQIRGWLRHCMSASLPFLDVGCGPGMLIASAFAEGFEGFGIDVSLVWLVVAQRVLTERGAQPILAAALGEALPLADRSVAAVVSLDVIEHVADPGRYLEEIDRVTVSNGHVALSTPNRFSVAAEPHVFVWGVGWIPYAWQKAYVRFRKGENYLSTRLLSTWAAARLMRRHTRFAFRILIPPVPEEEIVHFRPYRAKLARFYNFLIGMPLSSLAFILICPFFRILGSKSHPEAAAPGSPATGRRCGKNLLPGTWEHRTISRARAFERE